MWFRTSVSSECKMSGRSSHHSVLASPSSGTTIKRAESRGLAGWVAMHESGITKSSSSVRRSVLWAWVFFAVDFLARGSQLAVAGSSDRSIGVETLNVRPQSSVPILKAVVPCWPGGRPERSPSHHELPNPPAPNMPSLEDLMPSQEPLEFWHTSNYIQRGLCRWKTAPMPRVPRCVEPPE